MQPAIQIATNHRFLRKIRETTPETEKIIGMEEILFNIDPECVQGNNASLISVLVSLIT